MMYIYTHIKYHVNLDQVLIHIMLDEVPPEAI